jgi:uncharacterized membrane protein
MLMYLPDMPAEPAYQISDHQRGRQLWVLAVAFVLAVVALVLTGVLAAVSVAATDLTGVVSEDDMFLSSAYRDVNMRGLLLASIAVGSLGVLDDVAVIQTVTVAELARGATRHRARWICTGRRCGWGVPTSPR